MRPLTTLVAALAACGPALAACSSAAPAPAPAPRPAAAPPLPDSLVPDCFLGADRCVLRLDLDGDARTDTITTVRDRACEPNDNDEDDEHAEERPRPCLQGLWLRLAAGPTQLVGAGTRLDADPAAPPHDDPIPLHTDLDYVHLIAITRHRPDGGLNATQLLASPCAGDALILSGSDAAALFCWRAGSARAYHLGY